LFPRYLFSLIDVSWYPILGTYGVSYVLTGENGPIEVPAAVIDRIKQKEGPDGLICLDKPEVRFKKGDKVRAIDGPLAGRILIYDGMSARDRVRVLINMLGSVVHGSIHEQALVAV
jgi:transcription antitermination factor NusG